MRVDIEYFSLREKWEKYEGLLRELLIYQKRSICLYLDGRQSTPHEIIHACMTAEDGGYMRDYIGDDSGKLVKISFDRVRE